MHTVLYAVPYHILVTRKQQVIAAASAVYSNDTVTSISAAVLCGISSGMAASSSCLSGHVLCTICNFNTIPISA